MTAVERDRRIITRLTPAVATLAVFLATQTGPWPLELWWLPIIASVAFVGARCVWNWGQS